MTKEVDYSVLEGKEVKVLDSKFDKDKIGIVIGCDRDIGITIINKYNKNNYILCLAGPSSPQFKECSTTIKVTLMYFDFITTQIRDGIIDWDIIKKYAYKLEKLKQFSKASSETCSFN